MPPDLDFDFFDRGSYHVDIMLISCAFHFETLLASCSQGVGSLVATPWCELGVQAVFRTWVATPWCEPCVVNLGCEPCVVNPCSEPLFRTLYFKK